MDKRWWDDKSFPPLIPRWVGVSVAAVLFWDLGRLLSHQDWIGMLVDMVGLIALRRLAQLQESRRGRTLQPEGDAKI